MIRGHCGAGGRAGGQRCHVVTGRGLGGGMRVPVAAWLSGVHAGGGGRAAGRAGRDGAGSGGGSGRVDRVGGSGGHGRGRCMHDHPAGRWGRHPGWRICTRIGADLRRGWRGCRSGPARGRGSTRDAVARASVVAALADGKRRPGPTGGWPARTQGRALAGPTRRRRSRPGRPSLGLPGLGLQAWGSCRTVFRRDGASRHALGGGRRRRPGNPRPSLPALRRSWPPERCGRAW